ncbi:prepilin peptidase [Candidatus Saccharibacteria bacterium]|nr:MAG: prepilin peptidase [Candidatus Saccharibacteria bacterium]
MITSIVALGLLGVIFGSFVNALVWRLHEQAEQRKKKPKKQAAAHTPALTARDLSITKGRSMCPNCHHTLAAKDLVPVFSWFWLRGKCRYCHKPISWQYPLVEVITGVLFALSYVSWPHGFSGVGVYQFVFWLFYLIVFMVLAVYDLRWFLLPDKVVFPLIGVALVETVSVAVWQHSWASLWQPLAGGVIIFGLFYLLFQVSKGAWIGGGDVKLAFALGLMAGSPVAAFLVLFFASLLGVFGSIPLLLHGKDNLKAHIPFGPYLLSATVLVVLYGARITEWYTGFFLPGV